MKIMFTKNLFICLFISSLLSISALAQTQNALDFDGVDDEVIVPGGASLIAGATNMSLTCWVFPTNASPAFPNFDGFAGCRNDVNADFYLLQVGAGSLEARLKNSSGTVYTITKTCLVLNTWQHLALTYDGSKLRLYYNGNKIDSLNASGVISPTATNDFLIGNNLFLTQAKFYLAGKVDETSLWNKTLTSQQVNCIYHGSIDSTDANLKLYFRLNEGIANGNNVGISSVADASGHINGVPTNFSLNSSTSNFVDGPTNYTTATIYICQGSTYSFNGVPLGTAGNYLDTLVSSGGCDSIVQLTLNVIPVDTSVTQIGSTLTANRVGATYQWVNCNTGYSIIPGATGKIFYATAIGSYAVIVKQGGVCSDTSSCYNVTVIGINESTLGLVSIQPNLVKTTCTIDFGKYFNNVGLKLYDVNGRIVRNFGTFSGTKQLVSLEEFPSAVYFLKVIIADEEKAFRIVKD